VTLSRRALRAVPRARIDPIAWTVDAFTLVRSETGSGRYEVVERFAPG
jgi:2'-5' RNA ligase